MQCKRKDEKKDTIASRTMRVDAPRCFGEDSCAVGGGGAGTGGTGLQIADVHRSASTSSTVLGI